MVLFNTIHLRSKEQMNKLVDNMHLETQKCSKVERVLLETEGLKKFDINTLSFLFPNIFELILVRNVGNKSPQFTEAPFFKPWKKTIELITNIHGSFPIYQILKIDQYARLKRLSINGELKNSLELPIDLLGNIPNLKILRLSGYQSTLLYLEVLHNKAPLLESLSLNYIYISTDIFPTDINPAICTKKLCVKDRNHKTNERFINIEKGVSKKYFCIIHLEFGFAFLQSNDHSLKFCMNSGFSLQIQHIGS